MAQGNSGTHTVYHAICNSGLPALHFYLKCNLERALTRQEEATVKEAHDDLMALYARARDPKRPLAGGRGDVTVAEWTKRVLSALWRVAAVARAKDVTVMDSPYAAFPAVLASRWFRGAARVLIPRNSTACKHYHQRMLLLLLASALLLLLAVFKIVNICCLLSCFVCTALCVPLTCSLLYCSLGLR